MNEENEKRGENNQDRLIEQVALKEKRKIHARRRRDRGIWSELGMMGMIGWSVTVPTLLGVALGCWIDSRWPSRIPWTLLLLLLGLAMGCFNAWYWVMREQYDIDRDRKARDGD